LYTYTLRALSTPIKAILIASEALDSPVVGAKVDTVWWSASFVSLPILASEGLDHYRPRNQHSDAGDSVANDLHCPSKTGRRHVLL
jgi:hypothetical protein